MNNLKVKLGNRIKELRKARNMTQEELSEIMNIDVTSLSKIETGRNYPQPETMEKLAKALDIKIQNFFMFDDFSNTDDYVNAINTNIGLIKNDLKKLKIIYDISCSLVL